MCENLALLFTLKITGEKKNVFSLINSFERKCTIDSQEGVERYSRQMLIKNLVTRAILPFFDTRDGAKI